MIYSADSAKLDNCYDAESNNLLYAYDAIGNIVFSAEERSWYDEVTIEKLYDSTTSTYYYVVTVPQIRSNGKKQYPFVFVPNGSNGGTMSTLEMMQEYDLFMAINGGVFDYSETHTYKPYGINIQNGIVVFDNKDTPSWQKNTLYTLTINSNGKLNYAGTIKSGITAQELIENGAISAVLGFIPLVVDGGTPDIESTLWDDTGVAQRQIIGQKANGDYIVITAEGRSFDNSRGLTIKEAQTLCLNTGLDFAFLLDGGGSTETVIGETQLNKIYERTTGRIVPTYIIFNGTDVFSASHRTN